MNWYVIWGVIKAILYVLLQGIGVFITILVVLIVVRIGGLWIIDKLKGRL